MSTTDGNISSVASSRFRGDRSVLESADDLLQSIEQSLTHGKGQRAARLLIDAIAGRLMVAGLTLEQWLRELDEPLRSKIVLAFAHYPCFACTNGSEPCDSCGGSGFGAVEQVCAACAGLASKRCDFCNGSGLATYSVVPKDLLPQVVVARATRAGKYLARLLAPPIKQPSEAAMVRHVQDINKLLGVLENGVVAARQLAEVDGITSGAAKRITAACDKSASAGMARMREMLQGLAEHHRSRAAELPPVDSDNALAKADFYDRLAHSERFEGTGLGHPFLCAAAD